MNSNSYHNQLIPLIQGTKVSSISKTSLKDTVLLYPKSTEEQALISESFTKLNNLIILNEHKLEKLKALKKAYLSQMFPSEGECKPKLRFAGFNDEWEQHKLMSSVTKVIDFRGRTPKKLGLDWSESGYLALSALNVKNGYIDPTIDAHYGNQELYDKWMSGNELHKGQVLFTTEAPMGNVAQIPDCKRYILSQRTIAFEVNENVILENYLAVALRNPFVFEKLTTLSSGGTAKGVSQKSLAEITIQVPKDLNEQKIISDFFRKIDNLITLHQRKLEKLQNLKKAYLNEMFV